MFGLGTPELIIILVIAFFIFGGRKLPEIGASLGKALGSFKKGLDESGEVGDKVVGELTRRLPGVREVTAVKDRIDQVKKIGGKLS